MEDLSKLQAEIDKRKTTKNSIATILGETKSQIDDGLPRTGKGFAFKLLEAKEKGVPNSVTNHIRKVDATASNTQPANMDINAQTHTPPNNFHQQQNNIFDNTK